MKSCFVPNNNKVYELKSSALVSIFHSLSGVSHINTFGFGSVFIVSLHPAQF